MTIRNIDITDSVMLRTVAGKAITLDMTKISDEVLALALVGGIKIMLTNAWNGGGAGQSEDIRLAQMMKRVDAWYRGEYVVTERAESVWGAMREAFLQERIEAGASRKDGEALISASVEKVFGKDTKATFEAFVQAFAFDLAKREDAKVKIDAPAVVTKQEAIVAKYTKLAAEAATKRKELGAKLDLSSLTL